MTSDQYTMVRTLRTRADSLPPEPRGLSVSIVITD